MKRNFAIVLIILVTFSGCQILKPQPDEDMFAAAASMKRLSASVESSARYKDIPADLKDYDLLVKATENNPRLLNGFENYLLKAIIINKHSIVLMCDLKGERALIEDTGCTGEVDVLHWQNNTPKPCDFTIDVSVVCVN